MLISRNACSSEKKQRIVHELKRAGSVGTSLVWVLISILVGVLELVF